MRVGILADIHAHVENLGKAISRLRREPVDLVVVLGDVIYDTRNARETVAMLNDCGAIGVWGNHELGLCVDPEDDVLAMFPPSVIDYFRRLKPQLAVGDVLCSHVQPNYDASDPLSYALLPRPYEDGALDESFAEFPHRLMLAGHCHRWFAATPRGPLAWDGDVPLELQAETRYFIVVHAVMNGYAAILDDEQNVLTPIRL